ncbi:heparanase-like isoform X1 [Haliotis rufescens]|uniref:heparanase-like isoform X1 n=1 Tax=Haliotis rufescens TaxID=6454 RepID=UPI00201F615B|nr:heparanase-like isoform X1 [Haliotis rufescens]
MALLGRLLFLSVALFPDSRGLNVNIYIDTNVVLNRVQDNFVGVTLDSGIIQTGLGKSGLNLSSPKLLNLAGGFQPNILRIGGTAEDGISFDPNSVTENNQGDLSTSVWDEINAFTSLVGWDLIFGLNVLERRDGQWDPTNAELFLNYTSKKGYQLYGLELGNEPRMFPKKFNQSVSAQQLGKDFGTLEKVLRDRPHFNNTRILGPDVADILSNDTISYVEEFLAAGRASALEGVTFHQYFGNGDNATKEMFTDPTFMDTLNASFASAHKATGALASNKPLLLGETGSFYNGGVLNMTDTFLGGFLWMDKLGMAAQSGIQNVFRQDLYGLGSANRLLESFTYDPLPDYWLTFLFKKLVGNAVFKPRVVGPPTVRAYCHCMRSINPYYYPRGSLTVFAMNLDTVAVNLTFPEYKGGYMDYFLLSPEGDDVQSRTVILNGHQPIHLVENEIPFLVPGGVSANTITLPSLTYGFFVLYADARVCKPGN